MIRFSILLASAALVPAIASAQSAGSGALDQRVARVEKELRAVQRKVFPNGETQFVEPEIGQQQAAAAPVGAPASSPVADLSARVDALEGELSRMTAATEQAGYNQRQLQDAFDRYRAAVDARIVALEARGIAAGPAASAPRSSADGWPPAASPEPVGRAQAAPAKASPPADEAAPPPKASTGDPAEDAYLAGYSLWAAKRYADAEAALAQVAAKYPKHRRASYAQNLLGRAYLDDGQPAQAAKVFYKNYQDLPRGERAPDSLYYLGQALIQLKKTPEACRVYAELDDVYGPTLKDPLKGRAAAAEKDAGCKR